MPLICMIPRLCVVCVCVCCVCQCADISPKLQQKGLHSKALVSSVDMVPTALDWANVHYPNYTIWSKVCKLDVVLSSNTSYNNYIAVAQI